MSRKILFWCVLTLVLVTGCVRAVPSKDMVRDIPVSRVKVHGTQIAYRELGVGEPLVLVMGYAGTMDVWDPVLVARLANRHRVILLDNRGAGKSGPLDGELSIASMARDVLGLIDALSIKRTHVLGWSMGSMIAQEMALQSPGKVAKLVLYGTTSVYSESVAAAVDRLSSCTSDEFRSILFPHSWLEKDPDIFSRLPVPDTGVPLPVVAAQKQAMKQWSGSRQRLSSLSKDVLIVVGDEDWVTAPELGLDMARRLSGSWTVRFRQGGHWLMYQEPERLADVVQFFLSPQAR